MKINVNSWHYKYLRKNDKFPKENLCSYLWCLFTLLLEHTTWLIAGVLVSWGMGLTWQPIIGDMFGDSWLWAVITAVIGALTILAFILMSIGIVLLVGWLENKLENFTKPKFLSKLKFKCIKVEYTNE